MYDQQYVAALELWKNGKGMAEVGKAAIQNCEWKKADSYFTHACQWQIEAAEMLPKEQVETRVHIYRSAAQVAVLSRKYDLALGLLKKAIEESPTEKLRKDLEEAYCVLEHTVI